MAGQKINIQNKILLGTGTKPTIPNPSNINPDSEYWKDDTDILIGQWAYNATDNLWFTRDINNNIVGFSGNNKIDKNDTVKEFEGEVVLNFPENYYGIYRMESAQEFPVITTNVGQGALILLQGDGNPLHLPTFSGAIQDGEEAFDYTNNTVNPILFWNYGDRVVYFYLTTYIKN